MVTNYVDFHLNDLPAFGSSPTCKYRGVDVQCGPRGLKGAGDSLFHNNGNGTFTEVSKSAGVDDPHGYYGLGVVFEDCSVAGIRRTVTDFANTPPETCRRMAKEAYKAACMRYTLDCFTKNIERILTTILNSAEFRQQRAEECFSRNSL